MKKSTKILLIALAVILVASTVVAWAGPGKWVNIKKGQTVTLFIGRAGAHWDNSFYAGTANLYRKNPDTGYKAPSHYEFGQDILGVRFYDSNWNKINFVTGQVYVYFKLTQPQVKLNQMGWVSIKYLDGSGVWKNCPTFTLNGGSRVGCRINQFGEYALMIHHH